MVTDLITNVYSFIHIVVATSIIISEHQLTAASYCIDLYILHLSMCQICLYSIYDFSLHVCLILILCFGAVYMKCINLYTISKTSCTALLYNTIHCTTCGLNVHRKSTALIAFCSMSVRRSTSLSTRSRNSPIRSGPSGRRRGKGGGRVRVKERKKQGRCKEI